MSRLQIAACVLYGVVSIATFGHAAAYSETQRTECRAQMTEDSPYIPECYNVAGVDGLIAGLLWPFYWSWEAWS